MSESRALLILIPLLPLLSAVATAVLGPMLLKQRSHWLTILAFVGSFLCSLGVVGAVRSLETEGRVGAELVEVAWTWANVPDAYQMSDGQTVPFSIDVVLRADGLTALMLSMVTFVATLVAIYSIGYMHGDPGYWRFYSYVSLFVFSMTMLVLVSNFLLLFVFWEAVGVCSYLLIGFWYQKRSAASAGMKAFLVNRVGDFGFMLAIFLIWTSYGTLNYHDTDVVPGVLGQQRLTGQVEFVQGGVATAICLLLLLGACGKSAQFPLHVWLPDAMEGPTPVSALIHAATMVTAGGYMITRCTPLFVASPDAQLVVASVGGFTALLAGLIALTQFDLKRVLAYSTISQLGYMFLALGTGTIGGISAAMFHLFTHAFFKALLFLGAGSVMHSMGHISDMRRFSGLRHCMPWTHVTFLAGCLALSGIWPFAGFWSKDQIIAAVQHESHHASVSHGVAGQGTAPAAEIAAGHADGESAVGPFRARLFKWLYRLSLFTAFLTAFYIFRAYFMTFFGPQVIPEEAGPAAHESPPSMCGPLIVLAVFAVLIGWVLDNSSFVSFLATAPSLAFITPEGFKLGSHMDVAIIGSAVALCGIGLAAYLYLGHRLEVQALARWLGPLRRLSYNKFYIDELYQFLLIVPLKLLSRIDAQLDDWLVDGLVNRCARVPLWLGGRLRNLQFGWISSYSLMMVAATVLALILGTVLWGGG